MTKSLKDYSSVRDENDPSPRRGRCPPGMDQVLVYNSIEALRQLRVLAAETGTTLSALVGEGLNHVFRAHGKPQIAVDKRNKRRSPGDAVE